MESGLKLLPCPFCGGDGEISYYAKGSSPAPAGYFVECGSCSASGEGFDVQGEIPDRVEYTQQKAKEAWNTRALPPSDAALVEALEAVRDYRISANPTAPDAHHDLVLLQHVGRLRTIAIVALAAAKGQQP